MQLVRWSDDAAAQFQAIYDYVAVFDQLAAERLAGRLFDAAESLASFPRRGRQLWSGLHQLSVVYPYLIRYEVTDDLVTIVSVRHGARGEG